MSSKLGAGSGAWAAAPRRPASGPAWARVPAAWPPAAWAPAAWGRAWPPSRGRARRPRPARGPAPPSAATRRRAAPPASGRRR
ncbi:hypothetical protein F1D61_12745 [Methylobacterium aquaticum]|nr:hypothetical protein F1D61_12745 [Methylobacterium aquaticum]